MTAQIDPATRVGAIDLNVADLSRSLAYYEEGVGLRVQREEPGLAALGAGGEELMVLRELPGARPSRGFSGLFHLALLLPERRDLASWLAHAVERRVPLVGASDHYVSEALYLRDPDEHGIEIYWDRPREIWDGEVAQRMTTLPLDLEGLLAERDRERAFERLSSETRMGHVHLRVAEIPETIAFYRDVLGFELMASFGSTAAFLAAGGYHHHIGANTWESAGSRQPPAGTATLTRATLLVPDAAELAGVAERARSAGVEAVEVAGGVLVHDPSGNPLLLAVSPSPAAA
ncbi:MAG: VOC family protein [Solirubrobacteraceae bacterium]